MASRKGSVASRRLSVAIGHHRDTLYGFLPTTLPDVKQVFVHLNGNAHQPASSFVVHPRRIRTYEMFLNDLTDKMRPGFGAVRHVYTPVNGSRVRDLEDLENHQRYVIAGYEPFRKLRYADIDVNEAKRRTNRNSSKQQTRQTGRIGKSIRRRPYGWEPVHIFVYQNGDDVAPPVRISARRADLENWEHMMLRIGEKLDRSGFVKRLYNLNGDWVRGPKGIKNGQFYVAVGGYESFKQVAYGKLLDRLPQNFLRESTKKTRSPAKTNNTRANNRVTNSNPPRKIVPRIKAPLPMSRKLNHNKPKNGEDKDKQNRLKKPTTTTNTTTTTTSDKVRPKTFLSKNGTKMARINKETKPKNTETIISNKSTIKSQLPRIVEEPITTEKQPAIVAKTPYVGVPVIKRKYQEPKKTEAIIKMKPKQTKVTKPKMPTNKIGIGGGVVVIRSADNGPRQLGKSPPDSDDSAYMSENERRDRSKTMPRPKSFRLIDEERPLPPPNSNDIYYAKPISKSEKRVTLVDYDKDVGGVYKAKTKTGDNEAANEVQELENVPVELPIDELEAEEVGEYSDKDDEENQEDYYNKKEDHQKHHRYHSVAHTEADLRSSARTVS